MLCLDKTKKYKKYIKKPNILKNQKIQVKKDNIINKYNVNNGQINNNKQIGIF